ncbi:MAG: TolC family protein [Bacteroidales bacterium]|nr:TolC family protein [Bacteroidales bacterium]
MKKGISLWLTLSASMAAAGQSIGIEECQALARRNYPAIERYGLIERTTEWTVTNIARGWLPQVAMTAQATLQSEVSTLPDPIDGMIKQQGYEVDGLRKDQYRIGIDVCQTVYDGGTSRTLKTVAMREGEVEKAKTDVDIYAIAERVNELYFGILLTEERMRLNEDLLRLLDANMSRLESLERHGTAMESDVMTMAAERLNAGREGLELSYARESLMRMLGFFIGKEITAVEKPMEPRTTEGENMRPELRAIESEMLLIDAREEALNSVRLPKLSVFAQGYWGYPGYDMFEDMMGGEPGVNGMIGARMTWQIGGLYTKKGDEGKLATRRGLLAIARETFLFNNQMEEISHRKEMEKYGRVVRDDEEIVRLRGEIRRAAESKLEHGIIDTNGLLEEINRENRARIDLSTHRIMQLKEIYGLIHTMNY